MLEVAAADRHVDDGVVGAWSQRAATTAEGNAVTTGANTPEVGSFAFGPRALAATEDTSGLTFVADYSGRVLAVEDESGNLYSGSFELRVDWGGSNTDNVSATITDLRGIDGTSSRFQHNNRDVKSIFITGADQTTANGISNAASTLPVTFRYVDSSVQDASVDSLGGMTGSFTGNSTEGPTGVLGTWSLAEDSGNSNAMTGSFGADLKP